MNQLEASDAAGSSPAVERVPAPASLPSRHQRALAVGLAIAFGAPFLAGAIIRLAPLLGVDLGGAVLTIRLVAALAVIASLVAVVSIVEKRVLGSVGIRPPAVADLKTGLAVAAGCFLLAILIPSVFATSASPASTRIGWGVRMLFPARAMPLNQAPFLFALLVVAAAAMAQELAMRGFAASRLRTYTGSVLIGGAAALALDLIANLPLWGLRYTIEIAPIEALLVILFLWKRRLLPCIVADFTLCALVLIIAACVGTPAPSPAAPGQLAHAPAAAAVSGSKREQAIEKLKHALEPKSSPAVPFVERALKDAGLGEYGKAEAEMGKAIAADPKLPGLYAYRGRLYSTQNRHDLAIADYSKAIELAPGDPTLYRKRADEYAAKGDDVAAHRDFAKAIALNPDDPETYVDRSKLYVREDRYDEALGDANKAIKFSPGNVHYLGWRAYILELMHRYDRAIADCNRIIALDSTLTLGYGCRAQEEMAKGDQPAAIADLGEVIKRRPDDKNALSTRGDLEMQNRQWRAAHADLAALAGIKGLDAGTADWAAWALAASAHAELRDGKAAVALATQACEATGWKKEGYLSTLAAAWAESGDFAQAVKWQQRAIAVAQASAPNDLPFLRWQLAEYEKGHPYRENESGPSRNHRSLGLNFLAALFAVLMLVGLVTVIAMSVRLVRGGRSTAA
jgi:tetratricopeptide (TPR) repeat protein